MTTATQHDIEMPAQILPGSHAAFRARLHKALHSARFEMFITVLIVLNAIILGTLTYQYTVVPGEFDWTVPLIAADSFIVAIFVAEITAKIYSSGTRFFRSGWNIFDFTVVSISLFGGAYPLTVIRSLRVLRSLRIVTRVRSMRIVVESFMRALPGIGSVLMVMLIIIFVFSVVGTRMFGDIAPELFGTLHDSVFTMFTVLTLEGWPDVAAQVIPHAPFARLFFVSYIAINSFTVLNLMIAVIIGAMQKEYDDNAEEEREDILEELAALRIQLEKLIAKQ